MKAGGIAAEAARMWLDDCRAAYRRAVHAALAVDDALDSMAGTGGGMGDGMPHAPGFSGDAMLDAAAAVEELRAAAADAAAAWAVERDALADAAEELEPAHAAVVFAMAYRGCSWAALAADALDVTERRARQLRTPALEALYGAMDADRRADYSARAAYRVAFPRENG